MFAYASAVGANQHDFDTVVTRELSHSVGLGNSTDAASVMYPFLATTQARQNLTANDLLQLGEGKEAGKPEPLLAIRPASAAVTAQDVAAEFVGIDLGLAVEANACLIHHPRHNSPIPPRGSICLCGQ